jgi:hypothetical protein
VRKPRQGLSSARVAGVVAREQWAPVLANSDQVAGFNLSPNTVFGQAGDARLSIIATRLPGLNLLVRVRECVTPDQQEVASPTCVRFQAVVRASSFKSENTLCLT